MAEKERAGSVLEDRLQHFHNLMPRRVRNILLVASPYDSFLLAEDGQVNEVILNEFMELNLRSAPGLVQVGTAAEALEELNRQPYDLVITTAHTGEMQVPELAVAVKEKDPDLPVVMLYFDDAELARTLPTYDRSVIDQVFFSHGDFRILLAIVKYIEDRWNVDLDTRMVGVSVIILIEDNVRYYSSFLPNFYTELMEQSQRVIAEGLNLTHKLMRMRSRPKILLCTSYEEAEEFYLRYEPYLLGIISDVNFPHGGSSDPAAGLNFARMVRQDKPDLPIMLQTRDPEYIDQAKEVNASIVLKGSPLLLRDMRRFMLENFGFGDFVFRREDGSEVARARNLRAMETVLSEIPEDVIRHHASRHHFSAWLRARTEFSLAENLRRRQVGDFSSVIEMREHLLESIREFRRDRQSSVVAVFEKENFDPEVSFARIGEGSLGGKARGLAFVRQLLFKYRMRNHFPGVRIFVPAAVVLATDVFDQFLDDNELRDFAVNEEDDAVIEERFIQGKFPTKILDQLFEYLELADYPLAVRSSSLLEDSQNEPFAGIYRTIMCPNNHPSRRVRRRDLLRAIKQVYASTYCRGAKSYIRATAFRSEEEKMGVIIQRLGGAPHGERYYPEVAGVARSFNYYPVAPMTSEDGVATIGLGLGKTVVEGNRAYRFCPNYPSRPLDFKTPRSMVESTQRDFYALRLGASPGKGCRAVDDDPHLMNCSLAAAAEDHTLAKVASVYLRDNNAIHDGLAREGAPFVSMAPVLKHGIFPLPAVLNVLLQIGERGLNMPVELEFAINLSTPPGAPNEFFFLQMRPMVVAEEMEEVQLESFSQEDLMCSSESLLGNGRVEGIRDIVVVDHDGFDSTQSAQAARDVAKFNGRLTGTNTPYVLIGTGRWGSSEPWLGIPVTWDQIAGARVIVEATFQSKSVKPSQGSHFFHNLTASRVKYLTVGTEDSGFMDWDWIRSQPTLDEAGFVRHIRLDAPLLVAVDSHGGRGVIVKPATEPEDLPPGS